MTNNIKDYIQYFRNLAIKSKYIKHIEAAEKDDYQDKEKCRFITFTSEEMVIGLRSSLSQDVSIMLELYNLRGYDNEAGDFRANHNGRFLVCANKVTTLSDSIAYNPVEILAHTEAVTWFLINRILYDAGQTGPACNRPLSGMSLASFYNIEPQWNVFQGKYGWLVEFNYQQRRGEEMAPELSTSSDHWYQ